MPPLSAAWEAHIRDTITQDCREYLRACFTLEPESPGLLATDEEIMAFTQSCYGFKLEGVSPSNEKGVRDVAAGIEWYLAE